MIQNMTDDRYRHLQNADDSELTTEEITEGWHWCGEFDGLLVGPGMGELRCCRCLPDGHPAYLTVPAEEDPGPDTLAF